MKISRKALIWTLKLLRSEFPPDVTAHAIGQSIQIIFRPTGVIDFVTVGQRQAVKISLHNYADAPSENIYFHFNIKHIGRLINLTNGPEELLGISVGMEQGQTFLYLKQGVCESIYSEVKSRWVEDVFPLCSAYFNETEGRSIILAPHSPSELPRGVMDMRIGLLK